MHEDVGGPRLRDRGEQARLAPADVVDDARARLDGAPRDLGREGVGADRDAGGRGEPGDRGDEPRRLLGGRDRRPAAGGDRADVEQLEARLGETDAVGDRALGGTAAGALEEGVVGDVHDPRADRGGQVELAVGEQPGGRSGSGNGLARACRATVPRRGPALCLHGPRRHPAREGRVALPRRGGQLLEGAVAGARGAAPRRRGGRGQVRAPRGAGARGLAADGSDRLHLRGRLRGRDRPRAHLPDRRHGLRRGGHGLREDRRRRGPGTALRGVSGQARVPLALARPARALPPLPRQGRCRGGERAPRRAGPRQPALPRQRRDRPPDARPRHHPRLSPRPRGVVEGEGGRVPHARPRLRARGVHRDRRLRRGPPGGDRRRPLLRPRQRPGPGPAVSARRSPRTTT